MSINIKNTVRAILNSVNPYQAFYQSAQSDPAVQQAMQITNGKTPKQIKAIAQNMARQRGIDLDKLAENLGIKLPD